MHPISPQNPILWLKQPHVYFLSLEIFQVCTFPINWIIQYSFCVWLLDTLSRWMTCKYFLPFWEVSFHFLDDIICSTKGCLKLWWCPITQTHTHIYFYLLFVFLMSYLRKLCLTQGHNDLFLCFSSCTFSSMIHFELIFVRDVLKGEVTFYVAKFNKLLLHGF